MRPKMISQKKRDFSILKTTYCPYKAISFYNFYGKCYIFWDFEVDNMENVILFEFQLIFCVDKKYPLL